MSGFVIEFVFRHAGSRELGYLIEPGVDGLSPVGPNLPGVEGLVEVLPDFEPANSPTLGAVVSEDKKTVKIPVNLWLKASPELALVCVSLGHSGQLLVPLELHHVGAAGLPGLAPGHSGP